MTYEIIRNTKQKFIKHLVINEKGENHLEETDETKCLSNSMAQSPF